MQIYTLAVLNSCFFNWFYRVGLAVIYFNQFNKFLTFECSGKKKLLTYKAFSSLKYDQTDCTLNKKQEEDEGGLLGDDNLLKIKHHSREEDKSQTKRNRL